MLHMSAFLYLLLLTYVWGQYKEPWDRAFNLLWSISKLDWELNDLCINFKDFIQYILQLWSCKKLKLFSVFFFFFNFLTHANQAVSVYTGIPMFVSPYICRQKRVSILISYPATKVNTTAISTAVKVSVNKIALYMHTCTSLISW